MRFVLRCGSLFLLLALCIPGAARAQSFPVYEVLYRPPEARYFVLKSRHFDVIFQEDAAQEARETAALLEAERPATQGLVGARRRLRMPVVLNRFNDRSNGFVAPFPFRQEIETVAIKGNLLSARFSSWLWAVGPHELVHAAQADGGRGFGVGAVTRLFAPDLARSFNFMIPAGMSEGAAVYHESRVQPGAGRLHFSLFQMQFRAAMLSERPWSLAQMLEVPAYSRPANRFYIGGSNFFRYLAEQDSARFFRRAMAFHYRFPFLGHGVELWHGAGARPARLHRRFREAVRRQEQARLDVLGPLTHPQIVGEGPGRSHRRPRWLDDSTLVAYVSGYDVRPGFYRLDARTGRRTRIGHHAITEDFYFSRSADGKALLFARYVPDPLSAAKALGEVFRMDLATGRATALTGGGRVLAPVEAQGRRWGLQNDGPFNRWVEIREDGRLTPLTDFERAAFLSLHPAPDGRTVAVLLNVRGRQGIFRAAFDAEGRPALTPWLLFEDASILDADWSADGRYLLFTADPGGIANVYAFDPHADRVLRLTNAAFGALEPSLSPDGRTLAFVHYRHEQYDLAVMPFAPEQAQAVPRERLAAWQGVPWQAWLDDLPETPYEEAEVRRYRALPYLKPRMLYPTLYYENLDARGADTDLGLGLGLAAQGADPLRRWAYLAEAFYQHERAWGRLTVLSGRTFLHPFVALYDVPSTRLAQQVNAQGEVVGTVRVGREERGVAAGVQVPLTLASNVFVSQATVLLRGRLEQERFFDREGQTLRAFRSRVRLTPAAVLAYRLQANPRDLIPNTGTVLSAAASVDAWREAGAERRALLARLSQYVPLSLRRHTGLRLQAGLLTQNRSDVFNLDLFLPRGYEDAFLDAGTFARLNLETVQPLWFIDDGLMLLPLYFKALYAYGFAETLFPVEGPLRSKRFSAAGAGLGLQLRFFYLLNFDLRLGATYLFEERRWKTTYR